MMSQKQEFYELKRKLLTNKDDFIFLLKLPIYKILIAL